MDTPKRLPRPLSDEQVLRLEACIKEAIARAKYERNRKVAIRDLACFYLLWHCGMRSSEVRELLVRDVDLPGRKLFIEHSKEGKDRMIYISETAAAALSEHFANRRRPGSPYVFAGRNGPMGLRSINYRFVMYREQCGVPVTPHRLRHTFGRPFGRLVNISSDMARCQERVSSPWRFRVPSRSELVSFQGT